MKTNQLIYLGVSVTFGLLWIFILQSMIFLYLFSGVLQISGVSLAGFLEYACSPAFQVFWFGCITSLLIWISITLSGKPRSSMQTRELRPKWWLAAGLLTLYGWFSLFWCTVLQWTFNGEPVPGGSLNYYPVPPSGWLLLMLFVVLDVGLLFWIPTLLATPRNYRLVVPGAVKLLGSR